MLADTSTREEKGYEQGGGWRGGWGGVEGLVTCASNEAHCLRRLANTADLIGQKKVRTTCKEVRRGMQGARGSTTFGGRAVNKSADVGIFQQDALYTFKATKHIIHCGTRRRTGSSERANND